MGSYAVFLRGINVGGINIKMAELRSALERLPSLSGVKTLLASGNVVVDSGLEAPAVKEIVEGCLRDSFGYEAWVVVLSAERIRELLDKCPYPDDDKSTHSYVTLSSDPGMLDELSDGVASAGGVEQLRLGPEALAWLAPAGKTLDSPFSKLSAKPRYKSSTTTRNLRTLIKVGDVLKARKAALEG